MTKINFMTQSWIHYAKLGLLALILSLAAIFALQPVLAHEEADHDEDGVMDEVDVDTDGDTYPDCVEKGKYRDDSDNDGVDDDEDDTVDDPEDTTDTDADGIPDYIEKGKYRKNHDNDGNDDAEDLDDDNDGSVDKSEDAADKLNHDDDMKKDKKDADDDNDGVKDFNESDCGAMYDHDNDDDTDKHDGDDDDDGIEDGEDEDMHDHDNDGEADNEDDDDDNDGIEDDDDAMEHDSDNDGTDDKDDMDEEDDDEADEVKTETVEIENFAFSPDDITINVGDSITFTNNDSTAHTASADNGEFNTGTLSAGALETVTFATAGTFNYFCAFHPSMTGTVTVEE